MFDCFLIFIFLITNFQVLAALISVAAAVPALPVVHYAAPTVYTTHAQTHYAPVTHSKYGSQVNHLVQAPAPIYQGVPQPYAVPVAQPFDVPRPVPVAVPRPVPVDVPRAVPVPLVAQAAPVVTSSVVHAAPLVAHGYAAPVLAHGYAGHGYAGHGALLAGKVY